MNAMPCYGRKRQGAQGAESIAPDSELVAQDKLSRVNDI